MSSKSGGIGGRRISRPGEDLHLKALNVESMLERIALSQRRNLLFTAFTHRIYVWEPAGTLQTLGSEPRMIITPVMKNPESRGYISSRAPHAINNILVDDLGREEVLLIVTDSGNVCGYHVESIFSALERAEKEGSKTPLDGSQVDPFFVEFVERSAWGIATHKFARLIAVSSNTAHITVFAFALVDPTAEHSEGSLSDFENDGQTWIEVDDPSRFIQLRRVGFLKNRSHNIKLTYTGHSTNIPSVSFLNSDIDPNGNWMVSTDIDNKMFVWKIWESLSPFNEYDFEGEDYIPGLFDGTSRGWSVLALDPRAFRMHDSITEACGGAPRYHRQVDGAILDLSALTCYVPKASNYLYDDSDQSDEPEESGSDETSLPNIFDSDCLLDGHLGPASKTLAIDDENEEAQSLQSNVDELPRPMDTDPQVSADTSSRRVVFTETMSVDDLDSDGDTYSNTVNTQEIPVQVASTAGNEDDDGGDDEIPETIPQGSHVDSRFLHAALFPFVRAGILDIEEDAADENPDSQAAVAGAVAGTNPLRTSRIAYESFEPSTCFSFPILHFTQTDIRLFASPYAALPSAICREPLQQDMRYVPPIMIHDCDRFNMVKYVPEHSVVVAASQKGRVAVISLTGTINGDGKTKQLAFRVDWIVPFQSQEKQGDRPLVPILGMAVSPMQGFEIPPDVPAIPQGAVQGDDLSFHYQPLEQDRGEDDSVREGNDDDNNGDRMASTTTDARHPDDLEYVPREYQTRLTLAESHARASRAYRPDESWRGWTRSRHYRLLLLYADHAVMTYEFWYEWSAGASGAALDEEEGVLMI
ncbi:hypothetical protein ASPZODRAFT_135859 [Penicilliopsis zonata CBS 506.65]|uniref:Uncharacterized protein n=1 Tax=Penicilliopsis zonata CBS 506.65 TaxID=1073090 RepID=A0A1L9S9H3_9EURO|nr:hypothetical protein ASPZODRAFT_135859 [Penicilliopsis zonata CBS 506.65]OJJ43832.1 hypothetical protein ASPZODRAFT_135859 [Penicilliopsis zonata CBS 506.65]